MKHQQNFQVILLGNRQVQVKDDQGNVTDSYFRYDVAPMPGSGVTQADLKGLQVRENRDNLSGNVGSVTFIEKGQPSINDPSKTVQENCLVLKSSMAADAMLAATVGVKTYAAFTTEMNELAKIKIDDLVTQES